MPSKLSSAQGQRIHALIGDLATAAHGGKAKLYDAAAVDLGVSRQTVHKWVKEMAIRNPRRRRSDAGQVSLPRAEAELVSALLMESHRRNGKRLMSVDRAVDILRANGMIRAEAVDAATGEISLLSTSAIARALKVYGLHPDTLSRPAAAISLASRHPNHVWQIDASLCVLYYLKRESGLRAMDATEFYKNKPGNIDRIENERVWRYAITDHASGHIYVEYVLGAESGENLATVFINAIQRRPEEPVHGVPLIVMLDPGSANTGALFKNLCRALQVRVIINQVGNPRAKGQVEKAHDLIEKSFESRLKLTTINSLAELNAAAARWRRSMNGGSVMARHGMTRYEAWLRITADQLRVAPEAAVCRELATTAPEERTVTDKLQVSYRGATFDVAVVPHVQTRDKLLVCRNPWRPECAQVVATDADGREVYWVIEPVAKDAYGFDAGAPVIGENYARHADTPAQTSAKTIEKLLMGEETLEAAAAARKGKRVAFGGAVDPWLDMDRRAAALPIYLPKRGTALETPLPGLVAKPSVLDVPARMAVEEKPLSVIQAAGRLKALVPDWGAHHYQMLSRDYPQGVMESELPALAARFKEQPRIAAVGGASG